MAFGPNTDRESAENPTQISPAPENQHHPDNPRKHVALATTWVLAAIFFRKTTRNANKEDWGISTQIIESFLIPIQNGEIHLHRLVPAY